MISLSIPKDEQEMKPRITVVGVGGAGGNAVNNMIRSNLIGCEFVVCNTDAQALQQSAAPRRIQLGVGVTRGLGAGSRPDVGRAAAEEALDEILAAMQGSNMVFITAGMGGGTGTGGAPVIARVARESGILTVGVVTKPFQFEGSHRMKLAEAGIEELQKFVDTLIIIPNQNLFRIANERTTFAEAFKMADDVLHSGVRGVTDLMVMPGLINLDFADIRTVMSEMGKAMMGTGEAEGERRAVDAAEAAISNPLLEDVSMKGAKGVLINITGGPDMTLFEVDEAANRIREEVDPEANIIFGSTFDETLNGSMRISVVATGIDAEIAKETRPTLSLVSSRPVPLREATAGGYAQPMLTQNAVPAEAARAQVQEMGAEPLPPAAEAAETAAMRGGAFIAPKAVEPGRPAALTQPA
ncbi:MAG TPA: cell division protein FtsZ, partial [Stellaceae bacterium]|nr:cell division protein FtsZ [Stellaceae bacterium]